VTAREGLCNKPYSGERFIIQREEGKGIGIVPLEDIKTLERIEEISLTNS